ncbi:hypothetical protein MBLNU459_g4888t1 [Dothideomycetes sp. NU459]
MADTDRSTDGPAPFDAAAWDPATLPDYDHDFIRDDELDEFAKALAAPDTSPSEEDLLHPSRQPTEFITALNDWRPINQKVKGRSKRERAGKKRPPTRNRDETREGWTYNVLKWPLLLGVLGWIVSLGISYLLTRVYIYLYERFVTWRGRRQQLRRQLQNKTNYRDWIEGANELDRHLGSDRWKETDEYAYYDSRTVRRVKDRMRNLRRRVEREEKDHTKGRRRALEDLRGLVEACVKNNFAGTENPRLYSETYYGTKDLLQEYIDEVSTSLRVLFDSDQLTVDEKRTISKHLGTNFGRTALCLSGGATFAYYHFGIAKALLDADLLPSIITGTSGGALVASLLGTRTNDELKAILIPALASRITACHDSFYVWARRWYNTGARFDSIDWAKRCSWFCRGSLTFLEAYQRTGRILNVSCVPSDPHSPTILANYLTAPDCVIWSAVLASAAVPGILNPVVLMRKNRDGKLEPYSFGHKWKDGSLRTDIPLKALNLHFNVNFSIVSQVNPHINLFFFSSRGSVGRPSSHRKGKGWRGGYLGSFIEQYVKLDLTKWLKVLKHLELLPRPMGQDWSDIWLQRFSGTITIWPKSIVSDFWNILSDPSMDRLARMIHVGQQAAFPKLKFIANRMKIEKVIEEARRNTRVNPDALPTPSLEKSHMRSMLSSEDLEALLAQAKRNGGLVAPPELLTPPLPDLSSGRSSGAQSPSLGQRHERDGASSPALHKRFSSWLGSRSTQSSAPQSPRTSSETVRPGLRELTREGSAGRRSSVMAEIERQSRVFFDDPDETADDQSTDEDARDHSEGDEEDWRKYGAGETESEGEGEGEGELDELRREDEAADTLFGSNGTERRAW